MSITHEKFNTVIEDAAYQMMQEFAKHIPKFKNPNKKYKAAELFAFALSAHMTSLFNSIENISVTDDNPELIDIGARIISDIKAAMDTLSFATNAVLTYEGKEIK